jgi:ABC-type transport system involved in multi-copper enzyme maturation permease subunit
MYLWKCWRDTRSAFLVMAGGILFSGAFGFFLIFDVAGWRTSQDLPGIWLSSGHLLVAMPVFAVPLAGFFLGACGVGEELGKGSSAFLIARPRSRRYFLWTGWFAGACQVLAIFLLAVLFRSLRLLAPPHAGVYPGPRSNTFQPGDLVMIAALGLLIYSLTYFFTTILRSGRLGSNVALATVIIYSTVKAWLAVTFQIHLPLASDPYLRRWFGFPWHLITDALPSVALAVILVYAAQLHFERAEA